MKAYSLVEGENQIVHGLWIGDKLSALELLTLESFLHHGHRFHLWTYGPLLTQLPEGVVLCDANEVIPASNIFCYKHGNEFGHGLGSYAGFSDLFRYKLLLEHGGWWTDMDITCLRPLNFPQPYVFRRHDVLPVVGNLMKCPRGSELMRACYEEARMEIDAENRDWLKPIRILNHHLSRLGLEGYIQSGLSNPDRWEVVDFYRSFPLARLPRHYVFHWMNEEWRARGIDKNACIRNSGLSRLFKQYNIPIQRLSHPSPLRTVFGAFLMLVLPRIPRPVRLVIKRLMRMLPIPGKRSVLDNPAAIQPREFQK